MRKNKSTSSITIGVPILLVVFIILCLVTFACLSLSTAKSDYSFSQKIAVHNTAYYEACNKAEEYVHKINTGEEPPALFWSVDINNKQALKVKIGPIEGANAASTTGNLYEIIDWQVVSTVEHDYNHNMVLIK